MFEYYRFFYNFDIFPYFYELFLKPGSVSIINKT